MIAYFDVFSGISGDMTLGALIDLGIPLDWLSSKLEQIPLEGFEIRAESRKDNHLRATNVFVDIKDDLTSRNYQEIKKLIKNSALPASVKKNSLTAFEKIAEAESIIHNTPIDAVHFHELGGIDALVDIIGTFLCIDYLKIKEVHSSRIPLGSGLVKCSHGMIPVPVPAVLSILKGVPVYDSGVNTEIVTPTGAAIITTLAGSYGIMPDMSIQHTGYGSGKKDTGSDIPNLLRVILGSPEIFNGHQSCAESEVSVVQTNIDDMNPEIFGYLMDQLFNAGAFDVSHIPVQMKKNRPGIKLEVICDPQILSRIIQLILEQSSSTGVRYFKAKRSCLEREIIEKKTRFGQIKVKKITNLDSTIRFSPEYDVCRKIAIKKNMPLKDVFSQINLDLACFNN